MFLVTICEWFSETSAGELADDEISRPGTIRLGSLGSGQGWGIVCIQVRWIYEVLRSR